MTILMEAVAHHFFSSVRDGSDSTKILKNPHPGESVFHALEKQVLPESVSADQQPLEGRLISRLPGALNLSRHWK
jgi:hypothetical protein